jgi:hypothetical protein
MLASNWRRALEDQNDIQGNLRGWGLTCNLMDLRPRHGVRNRQPEVASASGAWACSLAVALSLFIVSCGNPFQAIDMAGSWQLDTSLPRTFVFTFHTNHACEQALTGNDFPLVGTWTLEGNQLVMVWHSMSNEMGSLNIFGATPVRVTNRIVKLNDAVMVWRDSGRWRGTTLKRVKTPEPHKS